MVQNAFWKHFFFLEMGFFRPTNSINLEKICLQPFYFMDFSVKYDIEFEKWILNILNYSYLDQRLVLWLSVGGHYPVTDKEEKSWNFQMTLFTTTVTCNKVFEIALLTLFMDELWK